MLGMHTLHKDNISSAKQVFAENHFCPDQRACTLPICGKAVHRWKNVWHSQKNPLDEKMKSVNVKKKKKQHQKGKKKSEVE